MLLHSSNFIKFVKPVCFESWGKIGSEYYKWISKKGFCKIEFCGINWNWICQFIFLWKLFKFHVKRWWRLVAVYPFRLENIQVIFVGGFLFYPPLYENDLFFRHVVLLVTLWPWTPTCILLPLLESWNLPTSQTSYLISFNLLSLIGFHSYIHGQFYIWFCGSQCLRSLAHHTFDIWNAS